MTPDLEIRRGEEAHRVISAEIYREAFATIEERLISQLAQIEITKERAEYLRQLLVCNRKIKSYLEQVMLTGKMAEESQSLLERAKAASRALIR
jgi:hypothetical protein